jgi:hypothetical protein
MTVALAHCIIHSRELVMEVHQLKIFAIGTARGVTGHHYSRRRDNHQGQSGKHDANQFQSALVCHRKASFQRRPRKARPTFRLGPFPPSSNSPLVNSTNQIASVAADNDHGWNGPKQQNWHVRLLLIHKRKPIATCSRPSPPWQMTRCAEGPERKK